MDFLNSSEFIEATQAAEKAVLAAGQFLAGRYAVTTHSVELDGAHEKIDDDQEAEDIILATLRKNLDTFSYISEESQSIVDSDITFIIDPIEGTSNYLRSIPFFATQIAIQYKEELVAGYVYEPVKNVLYHAISGQGCFANGTPISVGDKKNLKEITLCAGSGSNSEVKQHLFHTILHSLLPEVRSVRIYGSTGLELAHVALGAIDAHVNHKSKMYDYAAGVVLVREAGGKVTNLDGDNWTLQDTSLIAANPVIHDSLEKILKKK